MNTRQVTFTSNGPGEGLVFERMYMYLGCQFNIDTGKYEHTFAESAWV